MSFGAFPQHLADKAAAYRAHPAWQEAVRLLSARLITAFENRPRLNRMMSEEARWRIATMLLFLHHGDRGAGGAGGVTLKRLQELCARYRFASPGRVEALVGLMRASGEVEQGVSDADRRARPLAPTALLEAQLKPAIAAHFAAIDRLEPTGGLEARLLRDPDLFGAYFGRIGQIFFSGVTAMAAAPQMRLFMGRDAGHLILMDLWLRDPARALPPRQAIAFPFDEVAIRYGVSRSHVRRLILAAEAEGLMSLEGRGGRAIRVLPALVEVNDAYVSAQLAVMQEAAQGCLPQPA